MAQGRSASKPQCPPSPFSVCNLEFLIKTSFQQSKANWPYTAEDPSKTTSPRKPKPSGQDLSPIRTELPVRADEHAFLSQVWPSSSHSTCLRGMLEQEGVGRSLKSLRITFIRLYLLPRLIELPVCYITLIWVSYHHSGQKCLPGGRRYE